MVVTGISNRFSWPWVALLMKQLSYNRSFTFAFLAEFLVSLWIRKLWDELLHSDHNRSRQLLTVLILLKFPAFKWKPIQMCVVHIKISSDYFITDENRN